MQHKFIKKIALAAVTSTLFVNFANADCLNLKSGKDYTDIKLSSNHVVKLSEQEVKSAKPVLVEFFWYGCSHCYHMDPMINKLVHSMITKLFSSVILLISLDGIVVRSYSLLSKKWA